MNLIEKVESAVNAIGLKFIYFDLLRANNQLNITEIPCVVCIRNPNTQLINAQGNYCEQSDFLLIFCDKMQAGKHSNFQLTSQEVEKIIEGMKNKAVEFIRHVQTGHELMFLTSTRAQKKYEFLDLNVAGYGLDCTIRERVGVCNKI